MMDVKEILFEIADTSGISGREDKTAEVVMGHLKKLCENIRYKNGNVIVDIGKRENGKPHVLLDAHLDQIGMICTYITEDGFIKVGNVGGLDRRLLAAQRMTIHGREDIKGVIATIPPHLSGNSDKKSVPEIEDIYIDTGFSKDKLQEFVSLGDAITFDTKCLELLNGRVTGRAFDDKSGIASILKALELIDVQKLDCSITVLFSSQEEIGERGAKIAVYEVNPDIAIAVDASFAYTIDDSEYKCGKMGQGPMIGISPSLSREISDKLITAAKESGIPYQIEVMSGLTSTNADQFSVNRCGVKTATVSVPLKYMHTPVEEIEISDVENTAKLLAEFLRRIDANA